MNHADVTKSSRLQRVLAALQSGPKTTMQLIVEANVCAVNSIVSELRANGFAVRCNMKRSGGGFVATYSLEDNHAQ